jgi:hypothetical protein
MNRSSSVKLGLLLFLGLSFFLPLAQAQTTGAIVTGQITDQSGRVVSQAKIVMTNLNTNVEHDALTNDDGIYRLSNLQPGIYRANVTKEGFEGIVKGNIELQVQDQLSMNFSLRVGSVSQTVTVEGGAPLLETTAAEVKQVIDSRTIDAIPLNGRNYLDLILLTPGVAVNTQARSDLTNRDTNGAIMGERAGNNGFLIDGVDNNDNFRGGVFQAFTQDAIQEFAVADTGYKAEYGNGSAAIVNVISKSGSNKVHGDAFLFARNDALDSSNVPGQDAPTLSRYDYGGTIGGPVRPDKSWFFGSIENVRENRSAIFPADVPASLLTGEDFSRIPENRDLRAFGKFTQKLSNANELRISLSWTRGKLENELASPIALPSASVNNNTKTWMGNASLTTVLSPHLLLDSSFSVRAQNFEQNQGTALGNGYEILFLDDGTSFDFGPPPGSIQALDQKYFTGREAVSWSPNQKHAAKFGVEYTRTLADGSNGPDLQNVIATIHPFFDVFGVDSFQIPQGVGFLNPGDNLINIRNHGISFFAQDDWMLTPSLSLSGGIRYDYDSRFDTTRNVAPRLGLAWSPDRKSTVVRASWGLFYDRYRLGIAQAVPALGGFNGTTLVELDYPRLANDALIPLNGSLGAIAASMGDPDFLNSHFGIPSGTLVNAGNIQALTGLGPTDFADAANAYLTSLGPPFIPVDFSPATGFLRQDVTGGFEDAIRVGHPFHTPYNNTFSIGVQRQLSPNLSVGATYIRRSIRDILGVRIANLSPASAAAGAPITTDGGPIQRVYGPWYNGKYNALVMTLNKRFSRRFQGQINYTYAKSTDNLLNSNLGTGVGQQGGGSVPTNNNDLEFDRGNSDLSVPHVFVASGVYELPLGIHLSSVLRATSGLYFSAAGNPIDYDGDGISSTRPPGTKRNQFRGPASANLDLRIEKNFRFGERVSILPLVEFFNITNAANPELINNAWIAGAPGPDFGKVRVPLPGREIQFGLRFNF